MFQFAKKKECRAGIIYAPLSGQLISLKDVDDPTFSQGIMGDGIAIEPNQGELKSPVNGKITMIFQTNHAIGILADDGEEVLIHIGIDTVDLRGKYFESFVQKGDHVTVGQKLIKFDRSAICQKGYSCTTMILVTNPSEYKIKILVDGKIKMGQEMMSVDENI